MEREHVLNLFSTRWTGFNFDIVTDEVVAFVDFQSKPSPGSAWSHVVKNTYPKTYVRRAWIPTHLF